MRERERRSSNEVLEISRDEVGVVITLYGHDWSTDEVGVEVALYGHDWSTDEIGVEIALYGPDWSRDVVGVVLPYMVVTDLKMRLVWP